VFPLGTYTSIRGVVKVKGEYLKIADEFSKNKLSEQETSFVKENTKIHSEVILYLIIMNFREFLETKNLFLIIEWKKIFYILNLI
jgi:hypothetical protein